MDYEVFLVARVAEARRAGRSEDEALAEGLARTGPVITSAAAIMVAVFGAFTLGEFVLLKMLGFALAVAVAARRDRHPHGHRPRPAAARRPLELVAGTVESDSQSRKGLRRSSGRDAVSH